MTFEEIKTLIQLINKSDLAEFKFEEGEQKIVIRTSKYSRGGKQQFIHASAPAPTTTGYAAPQPIMQAPTPAQKPEEAPKPEAIEIKKIENADAGLIEIKSPIVGTFYRSSSPEKGPYVKVGDDVDKGKVVCVIEAMKLFNEIESEIKGKIVKILVEDASPVEYEQPLFLVDPKG
jgi:acetyl-CoA carboxylase biotin carboxyl carrier protein